MLVGPTADLKALECARVHLYGGQFGNLHELVAVGGRKDFLIPEKGTFVTYK